MHAGDQISPDELIEFDNNFVREKQFSGERNEEKDVLASLALMGGNDCDSMYGEKGKE